MGTAAWTSASFVNAANRDLPALASPSRRANRRLRCAASAAIAHCRAAISLHHRRTLPLNRTTTDRGGALPPRHQTSGRRVISSRRMAQTSTAYRVFCACKKLMTPARHHRADGRDNSGGSLGGADGSGGSCCLGTAAAPHRVCSAARRLFCWRIVTGVCCKPRTHDAACGAGRTWRHRRACAYLPRSSGGCRKGAYSHCAPLCRTHL